MRIAFAYNHVYPETVGGAQRYYWALTRELAQRFSVSYLTVKRWRGDSIIERDGVELVGVGSSETPLAFSTALARHLAWRGRRYDVVHCACFPPGPAALARAALLPHPRAKLVVDWHEVLPRSSWRRIRGGGGDLRWLLQRLAVSGHHLLLAA
jgi:glycosyltransferase involved in cell wall biosynthesis